MADAGKYFKLFFLSGFPALLYQIVWQRALFTIYGVNVESVTVIVAAFMMGLGLGSLFGGWLSKRRNIPLLIVFASIEVGIAVFGVFSLRIFHALALSTAGAPAFQTGLVTFLLLLLPTLLMGSTLPLLVAHVVTIKSNVGESVGALYSANTFGSAAACFLAAYVLMRAFGESGCTAIAAAINGCVAVSAMILHVLHIRGRSSLVAPPWEVPLAKPRAMINFHFGVLLSAAVGFIALCYEMVWYRLYSFASSRTATSFALVLGWYLAGVAYGSLAVRDACRRKLRDDLPALLRATATVIICGNVAACLVGPALASAVTRVPLELTWPFVFLGSALLGASFPLITHASIDPADKRTGSKVSFLYLSNIVGCASGSYVVGFWAMDHLSIRATSAMLLAIGLLLGYGLMASVGSAVVSARRWFVLGAFGIVGFASWPLSSGLYERLLFKSHYRPEQRFRHIAESRSGVVTITQDGTVYGGGVYDGHVSLDVVRDVNGLFRALAVDALHPDPKNVLMIGLSMGAWAQVLANNPRISRLTIVEIDPGYLKLIPQYPAVASVLQNPKVEIVVDDGRRWLVRNPARRFDLVVMNTAQHWLAHSSNLLSVEFLGSVRRHLNSGGILYYNTTFSTRAFLTGVTVFPYGLRVTNFLAVSDSPITFDKERWRSRLSNYKVDGAPVLDLNIPAHRAAAGDLLELADTMDDADASKAMRIESADSLRRRFRGARLITDDNMGAEWSPPEIFDRGEEKAR